VREINTPRLATITQRCIKQPDSVVFGHGPLPRLPACAIVHLPQLQHLFGSACWRFFPVGLTKMMPTG
jgi:hypothetical protein